MPSWQSAFFARLTRISGLRSFGPDAGIDELRQHYDRLTARFGAVPPDAAFEPAQLGPVKGEWVRVEGAARHRLVLYFHGGGHIAGSPAGHRPLVARLCQAGGANAFSLDYRLAPEFAFPAGLRDGIDAYRHLVNRGVPASTIILAGDGSGGGLAFSCALAIRNAGLPMPAGIVAMSPWADLTLSGWSMLQNARNDAALSWELLFHCVRHYLRKASPADPYTSPVYADLHDFPPIMVHAGSLEILRDDASRLGDLAAAANVPVSVEIYDGMQHVFQASPYVPEARISLMRMGQFIKSRARDTATEPAQSAKA